MPPLRPSLSERGEKWAWYTLWIVPALITVQFLNSNGRLGRVVSRLLVVLGAATMSASLMSMTGGHSLAFLGIGLVVALMAWLGWLVIDRRQVLSPAP